MFTKNSLITWQREAAEELQKCRFCPNCNQSVQLVFKEHKHYQTFFGCPNCGENILVTGSVRLPTNGRGYSTKRNYRAKYRDITQETNSTTQRRRAKELNKRLDEFY